MAPKAKQTITLELIKDLGRTHMKDCNEIIYASDDVNVIVTHYLQFFLACAPHTVRLNAVSLGLMGKDVFQLSNRAAEIFGSGLASAYSHCMSAGAKATTGQKLSKAVVAVYNPAHHDSQRLGGIKREHAIKTEEYSTCKLERSSSPERKFLKSTYMESPTQIDSLYAGLSSSSSSSNVTKDHLFVFVKPDIHYQEA